MIPSRRLSAALTRTLAVKAEQATTTTMTAAAAPTFGPATPSAAASNGTDLIDLLPTVPDTPGGSRRVGDGRSPSRRRRLLVSAAALTAVLGLLGAGVLLWVRGPNEEPAATVSVGDPPDGWLVPTWVPDGMTLWGIKSTESREPSESSAGGTLPQLFGDPGTGRAMYITSFRYEVRLDRAEQVTVRGQAGHAGPTWDVEETDVGDGIAWYERGATITALYKGMSRDEAIAALETLEWRSDEPADGFAPPAGGSLPLRVEVESRQSVARDISFVFSDGVPTGHPSDGRLGLFIHTTSSAVVSAEYLEGWYLQGLETGDGQRPVSRYDQDWHELTISWPDGRLITIAPMGVPQSELPSRETLERIAHSLTIATAADLTELRDESGARIAGLPVLASADTRIGTVEVHGERGFVQLCLDGPNERQPSCRTDALSSGTAVASAGWTVDGTWYVAVASKGPRPKIVGSRDPSSAPDERELPAETTTAGEWTIRVVQPSSDIELVCTSTRDGTSCNDQRPD